MHTYSIMKYDTEGRRRLKAYLERTGRSQAWLAGQLKISQPSVSEWLVGESRPKLFLRAVIATLALIAPDEWLISGEREAVANAQRVADEDASTAAKACGE